jgi:hypothetical protein
MMPASSSTTPPTQFIPKETNKKDRHKRTTADPKYCLSWWYHRENCRFGEKCRYANETYLCPYAHGNNLIIGNLKGVKFNIFKDEDLYTKKNQLRLSPRSDKKLQKRYQFYQTSRTPIIDINYFLPAMFKMIDKYKLHKNIVFNLLSYLVEDYNLVDELCNINRKITTLVSYLQKFNVRTCRWCSNPYSYPEQKKTQQLYRPSAWHYTKNNCFLNAKFRQTCNIGPLCFGCAFYRIPIQCDMCNNFTNFNNIILNYSYHTDTELHEVLEDCIGSRNIKIDVKELIETPINCCLYCMVEYHQRLMLSPNLHSIEFANNHNLPYIEFINDVYGEHVVSTSKKRLVVIK